MIDLQKEHANRKAAVVGWFGIGCLFAGLFIIGIWVIPNAGDGDPWGLWLLLAIVLFCVGGWIQSQDEYK